MLEALLNDGSPNVIYVYCTDLDPYFECLRSLRAARDTFRNRYPSSLKIIESLANHGL